MVRVAIEEEEPKRQLRVQDQRCVRNPIFTPGRHAWQGDSSLGAGSQPAELKSQKEHKNKKQGSGSGHFVQISGRDHYTRHKNVRCGSAVRPHREERREGEEGDAQKRVKKGTRCSLPSLSESSCLARGFEAWGLALAHETCAFLRIQLHIGTFQFTFILGLFQPCAHRGAEQQKKDRQRSSSGLLILNLISRREACLSSQASERERGSRHNQKP